MHLRTYVRFVRGCAHTRTQHTHTFSQKTNTCTVIGKSGKGATLTLDLEYKLM